MVEESNQNVFLIQKDASSFAEFEISEFEISRFDCTYKAGEALWMPVSVESRDVVVHYGPTTATTLGSKHLEKVRSDNNKTSTIVSMETKDGHNR